MVVQVRTKGLAPKPANRCREVLAKPVNRAMETERVKIPLSRISVARVDRHRENASESRSLTLG